MADRIVLHIGAPKAATTFLQSMWWTHRDALAAAGVVLPGDARFDHNRAAQAVLDEGASKRVRRTWARMRREAAAAGGTVLISNEWFAPASSQRVRLALDQLADAGPVEVLLTARDPASTARAAWQEVLKLGRGVDLDPFLDALGQGRGRWRWRNLDPAEILARWSPPITPERVNVVTVPPSGTARRVLWERVATVLGVDPSVCDPDVSRPNPSLGVEAACLLRTIGPQLREAVVTQGGHWNEPYRWIRNEVAHDTLVPLGGRPIGLRPAQRERMRVRSERCREALRDAGYRLVGDLDELDVPEQAPDAVHPDDVDPAAVLKVAGALAAALLTRLRAEREADAVAPDGTVRPAPTPTRWFRAACWSRQARPG